MEISSFPIFQEDYSSNFYSLIQEPDPNSMSITNTANKRPGVEMFCNEFGTDLLSELLGLDSQMEEQKAKKNVSPVHYTHQDSILESRNKRRSQKMDDSENYLNIVQNQDAFMGSNSGQSSYAKRTRTESYEVMTTSDDSTGGAGGSSQRRLWVKTRSKAWWEQVNSPDFPEEEFKKAFRMSRATFNMICEELEPAVTKKDTMLRLAIPVRQRVAVCIWRLATGEALREVSKRFGLGISTCHKLVLEGCSAIRSVLMPKFLQWPDGNRMEEIKREFEFVSGIPNVGGAMYTTHVPIIAPKINVAAYFNKRHTERNQKTSYSITVQGVVDPRGVFTDICIGWPGSMTDDQVLENSALFQRASRGVLKDVWVVGSSGYPLMDWVLVPYTHQNLTWTQHALNEKIEEVQRVAKDSFMRLKARWSCLQKRTEMKLQDLPVVLGACCVLHNICEMRNEDLNPELKFNLFDDEIIPVNNSRSVNAMHTRDQIAHKLLHHNLTGMNVM
ncbi:protein ANTAGONIST OF LIKE HETEROCHROMATIN PROTEIN 1-like [Olea europaea var. sylvestris]|uniref:protein ANTAGONIST OF LIKE HETEROCHROMATIN PROTEIN 1-like n=1 Tax=Olea europaea var. sylvestris TaxID=158386 RepID=UPI000C1D768B|nr:protein ANTAGONIST OF LIKE HETEROCHROMATIN PROTEIN 1-like [Olea europaea var. sylvestris]